MKPQNIFHLVYVSTKRNKAYAKRNPVIAPHAEKAKINRRCSVLCTAVCALSSDGFEEWRAIKVLESAWGRAGDIIEKEAAQTEASLESKDSERPTYISVNVTSLL